MRAPETGNHDSYTSLGDDEASDCTPNRAGRPKRQLFLDFKRYSYQSFASYVRRLHFQFYLAPSDQQKDLVSSEDVRRASDRVLAEARAF